MNFICFHSDAARPGLLRCVTRDRPSRYQSFYVFCAHASPPRIPCEIHAPTVSVQQDTYILNKDCVFAQSFPPLLFSDITSAKCAPYGIPLSVRGGFRCFAGKYVADENTWCAVEPDSTQTHATPADSPAQNALESCLLAQGPRGSVLLKQGTLVSATPSLPQTFDAYASCCLKFVYVEHAKKVSVEVFYMCDKKHRCDTPLHCPKCNRDFERGSMRTVRLARYKLTDSNGGAVEMDMWRAPRIGDPLLLARNGWGFTALHV